MSMSTSTTHANASPAELEKFGALAARGCVPQGTQRPLHDLHPARLGYVRRHVELAGRRVRDLGCGGGLLSEAMAREGAQVVGADLSPALVERAKLHLLESGLKVDYRLV